MFITLQGIELRAPRVRPGAEERTGPALKSLNLSQELPAGPGSRRSRQFPHAVRGISLGSGWGCRSRLFSQVRPLLTWLGSPCLPQQALVMSKKVLICARLLRAGGGPWGGGNPSLPGSGVLLLKEPHTVPQLPLPPLPGRSRKAQCPCLAEGAGYEAATGFLSSAPAGLDARGARSCPEVTSEDVGLHPQSGLGLTGASAGGSWACFSRRP